MCAKARISRWPSGVKISVIALDELLAVGGEDEVDVVVAEPS
jgi:hypothetical protein